MSKYSYDQKCEELANYFLTDIAHNGEDVQDLAQIIQDAIESKLNELEKGELI